MTKKSKKNSSSPFAPWDTPVRRKSRWPLGKAILFFSVFLGGTVAILAGFSRFFEGVPYGQGLTFAGLVILFTGIVLIFAADYCKRNRTVLVEFGVTTAIRTGIPLVAALVFFFTMGKLLLYCSIVLLVVIYFVVLPFEVWLLLPPEKIHQRCRKMTENSRNHE